MSVRVLFEGVMYEDETGKFPHLYETSFRDRLLRDGVFLTASGEPMGRVAQRRLRAYIKSDDALRGVSDNYVEEMREPSKETPRDLIPGLWPWGTIPSLNGQPKAGKTTLAIDLAAALTIPGYRFLDHFAPTELPMDAQVWLINAETPVTAFQDALYDAGVYDGVPGVDHRELYVEHLEVLGGPSIFDLTVPANWDLWASHFIDCYECRETGEFSAPTVVIVDGLTAILGGDTSRYGAWYPKFRELLRYLDIPNGLVISHATLAGTHSMGGTEALAGPDGLWLYAKNDRGRRLFSVQPRMGGTRVNPTQIVMGEDGRLRIPTTPKVDRPGSTTEESEVPASPEQPKESTAHAVLAFVSERNREGFGPRRAHIRQAVVGDSKRVDAAIEELLEKGQLISEPRKTPKGQTAIVYLIGQEPEEPIDGGKVEK